MRWAVALLLIGVTLGVYRPIMKAPFVYEDRNWLTTMDAVQDFGVVRWPSRWLTQVSYRWQAEDGVVQPRPLHLANVALHVVIGLGVFLLARRLAIPLEGALVATAIFLWHPLNVAAVSYVSARSELLMTLWTLVAVLGALSRRWWMAPVVIAACVLSGFAKELGALAIVLVIWTWDRRVLALGLPTFVVGALSITWVSYGVRWPSLETWWELASANVMSLWRILGLFVIPVGLNLDPDPWGWPMAVRGVGLGALLVAAWWVWRREQPIERWALGWVAIVLLPRVVMPTYEPIHDHHAYLAVVACSVWAGQMFGGHGTWEDASV